MGAFVRVALRPLVRACRVGPGRLAESEPWRAERCRQAKAGACWQALRACQSLLHLESFEAGGADPFAAGGWAFLDANFLQVRVSAAARRPQRVAARVAEIGPLAARITDFSHVTSPVLGYRSNLGTPENAIRKASPDVGRDCTRLPTLAYRAENGPLAGRSAGSPMRGAMEGLFRWP
jgi:hypothetical protein